MKGKASIPILCGLALLMLGSGANRGNLEAQTAAPQASEPAPRLGGASSKDQRTEADAVHSMKRGRHVDGPHLCLTVTRGATPADWDRAAQVAATLRSSIERYKDYRLAIADGYRVFMPNVAQPEYHFTNYWNGYLEGFTFDPARPTSLLYRKTAQGWALEGAMYTAGRTASLAELDERIPLGVARWHSHTNLCIPKPGTAKTADWKRFGLEGSISSAQECKEAGGVFYPQIFGWMVHVYPFESSVAKMYAQ